MAGTGIDVRLSTKLFVKSRAGLAVFAHLDNQELETLFSVRSHELWKATSIYFTCQDVKKPIDDHHFVCEGRIAWSQELPFDIDILARVWLL